MSDHPMPHDPAIERILLASCIYAPALLLADGVSPELFYHAAHLELYRDLVRIHADYGTVPVENLPVYLGDKHQSLFEDLQSVCSSANPEPEIRKLSELRERRRRITEAGRAAADAADMDKPLDNADVLERKPISIYIPTPDNRPPEQGPLVELNNVRILSPGGLAMSSGLAGTGKSSVIEAALSSVVNTFEGDSLGLRFNAKEALYVDTERSQGETHISRDRFLRRCGLTANDFTPACIRWENLRGVEKLEDRLLYLNDILAAPSIPEIIVIDGVGDFIADPNDSETCVALVSKLSAAVHERKIGIILTLHVNPKEKSTKARGVLGSELWRKCESVLIIEKLADGTRRLTTDFDLGKNRGGTDEVATFFRWDVEKAMHVSCQAPTAKATTGQVLKGREAIVKGMGRENHSHEQLRKLVMAQGRSRRTADRWISDLLEIGQIQKNDGGVYSVSGIDPIASHWSSN